MKTDRSVEFWKPIYRFEDSYEVSNFGRIRGKDRILTDGKKWKGRIIKYVVSNDGYIRIKLRSNGVTKTLYVHRLLMETFHGYSKLDVNHINGIKTDNRLENLEYVTRSENLKHAYKLGLNFYSDERKDKIRNNFAKTHSKEFRNALKEKNLSKAKHAKEYKNRILELFEEPQLANN